jgi:NADH-quinone oxidoreductase subunit M
MTRREKAVFAPLIAATLILGVYPALVTDIIGPSVGALITDYQAALPVVDATQTAQTIESVAP